MSLKETVLFNFLIWLCVYPSVLVLTYGFDWLGIEIALPLEILISTALSVPLIGYVAAPQMEKLIAHARGETLAELKMHQAEQAEGPDPVMVRDETGVHPLKHPAA